MATINSQWLEQISIGVSLSFNVNCSHSQNIVFESAYEQGTLEFNEDAQNAASAYELSFKTSPDFSIKDLNLNTATYSVQTFSNNVGVLNVNFNVINAEATIVQYYGFPDEMSPEDRQDSINTQVQQYEINYKIGYNLTDI